MDFEANQEIVRLGELIHDALLIFIQKDKRAAREIYYPSLEGGCAVAAAFLVRAVRNKLRVKADFVASPGHAWVESRDIIYDPTAIQFDRAGKTPSPKVKTLLIEKSVYPYEFRETKRISTINSNWPRGQRPRDFVLDWNGITPCFKWRERK